jgi:hypothetical protein
MILKSRSFSIVSGLVALHVALVVAGAPAQAQVKPFKITGVGVGPHGLPAPGEGPGFHSIIGEATHLGRHRGEGTVETDTADFDLPAGRITGEFGSGSPFVFTGANGEQLVCWYGRTNHGASKPGTFILTIRDVLEGGQLLVEAAWIAEFVPVSDQCTGKFAGVTGSWIMYAYSEPFVLGSTDPVNYWWEGEGTLTFQRGK